MVSFIIPAHNEERLLGATLAAVHEAGRALEQPYEAIVVDDGSTDATAAIAAAGGARVVGVEFRQIARARNAGANAARGDTLIFVDADTLVSAATVKASVGALAAGAVGGGAVVRFDGPIPRWAALLLPVIGLSLTVIRIPSGCYVFCSRAAFDAAGGFDERLFASEEIAFGWALKKQGRVVIVREPVVSSARKLRTHSGREVLRQFWRFARHGRAATRQREMLELWYGARRDDVDLRIKSRESFLP